MNLKLRSWLGKRVWLVGASSGIGAALAQALDDRGARLALSARRLDKLQALGIDNALLLPCDSLDNAGLAAARTKLIDAWDGIDLVVYLAGDYEPMSAADFDLARAEQIVAVNFTGAMRLTAAMLGDLQPGGGIAFVSSVAGYRGLPKALAYGPGKAALIHFAECLHLDLAPKGIGVWVINPGFVQTRLTAQNDFAMPALQTPEQAAQAIIDGFAEGAFRDSLPQALHPPAQVIRHPALPLVFPAHSPLYRRLT